MIIHRSVPRCVTAVAALLMASILASCGDDRIIAPDRAGASSTVTISSDPCTTPVPVTMNTTIDGTIAQTDCLLTRGTYADVFTFTTSISSGTRVHMSSDVVDAYVIVTSSTGAQWTDDDSGPGTGARLEATLPAGTYTVQATTKAAGGAGAYRLWVGRDAPPVIDTLTLGTYGTTVDGSVTHSEWLMPRGTYADVYRFTLSAVTAMRVNMMGSGFQPYILLRGITNTSSFVSDVSIPGDNAEVRATLQAGTYEIRASSAVPEGSGTYRLWVGPSAPPMIPVSLGQSPQGEITIDDWLLPRRTHGDLYTLTLTATTSLRVGMVSENLDAYLVVFDGTVSYTNDDAGTLTNARVIQNLPAGTYQIRATTKNPGESGAYRIFVDSEHTLPTQCSRAPLPSGYVVVGVTSDPGCPSDQIGYNEYLLSWPYGDEALEICSTPYTIPTGWVITSSVSSVNCPSYLSQSKNADRIKIPGESEEICMDSPIPAGYVQVGGGNSIQCRHTSFTHNTRVGSPGTELEFAL